METRGDEVDEWSENKRKVSREGEVMHSSRREGRLSMVSGKGEVGEV